MASETQRQIEENRRLVEAENDRLAKEAEQRQAAEQQRAADKGWR